MLVHTNFDSNKSDGHRHHRNNGILEEHRYSHPIQEETEEQKNYNETAGATLTQFAASVK